MNTYRCHDYEFQAKDDRGAVAHIRILSPGTPIDIIRWELTVKCNTGRFASVFYTRGVSMNNGDIPTLRKRMRELSKTS
jgi:hypothetical protein